ncbi:PAS domain-containing protein [Sphingomonas changnyeongensis]|uniref:PAS domain-containing protein n=1 Tax=Sphingomonas changnyeongensis TaxID=2698679 RepID=A0A7Z2NVB6_9SPHN|nr:PAS domain-containing protein [Sphingomonas changnyeongensis]QHL90486.1 PAS domain-containing protein [Sphingomonas changnyeongensis]
MDTACNLPSAAASCPDGIPDGFQSTLNARAGWRDFLSGLGIKAAVISCETSGACEPGGACAGRYLYIIGLDELQQDARRAASLIGLAERIWHEFPGSPFTSFTLPLIQIVRPEARLWQTPSVQPGSAETSQLLARFAYGAVIRAAGPGGALAGLLLRTADAGPFTAAVERQVLDAIPLFQDAALASAESSHRGRQLARLTAMFDQVSVAMILTDQAGTVLFANESAREMLAGRGFVVQAANGRIACPRQGQTNALREAIRRACGTPGGDGAHSCFRIGDPVDDWRLAVVVPGSPTLAPAADGCAMLLILDPHRPDTPGEMLGALGLLPSEQRFLQAFLATDSLSDAARRIGLTEETARTYLKRVRNKLGVHRQLELARLVYGLAPPIRSAAILAMEQGR